MTLGFSLKISRFVNLRGSGYELAGNYGVVCLFVRELFP